MIIMIVIMIIIIIIILIIMIIGAPTFAPSADLCLDQDPDHQDQDHKGEDYEANDDDDDDEINEDDEGGTCLGKYSKGSLLILKWVADVLFSQTIP